MSAKPKDYRPKVISFRLTLDGLNIAARQDILWPCHAFSISIPQKKKGILNFFEETIIKLTEIECGDTDRLADITCLEKELVFFIQNRLNHLGFLNNRYELSENGKKLLENWRHNNEGSMEYVTGTVFVDLHSGKLLPYIHIGDLKYKKIISINKSSITVEFGSTGTSRNADCRMILPSADSFWKTVPDSSDIIRAIREFKKKYKRYALLNQGVDQYPPPIPMAEAIRIQNEPELVYLHCIALIQAGNHDDFLVTDGCGFGFSESFAKYLLSRNWSLVTNLKKKGIVQRRQSGDEINGGAKNTPWKYPEITRRFKGIRKRLDSLGDKPDTDAKEKDYIYKGQQVASDLYEALEWALRYTVSNYAVSEWERIFISYNYRDNKILLRKFAEKIGFSVSEKNQSILQVKPGAIRQIEYGKVELQPLLAIAIAGAAAKYTSHPFHALAYNHSGFLGFALRLKRLRDPVAHGDVTDFKVDVKELKNLSDQLARIMAILLPEIAPELEGSNKNPANKNDEINQKRLKAIIELEKSMGTAFVSEMSQEIKELLIRAEIMLAQYANDEAIAKPIEIVKCFSSAMQLSIYEIMKNRTLPLQNENHRKETVFDRMVRSGFYQCTDDIPRSLRTVNQRRLGRAACGCNVTLGTNLMAVFLMVTENELIRLQHADPDFIKLISKLIRLRGHGNQQQISLSRDKIESIRNKVFKAIRIITEVF